MEELIRPSMDYAAPQISTDPAAESAGREYLNIVLRRMGQQVGRFATAVSLVRHCREHLSDGEPEPADWIAIAIRDAALSISQFGGVLRSLRIGLKGCPILVCQIDLARLGDAETSFASAFPDAIELQNAAPDLILDRSELGKRGKVAQPGVFLTWERNAGPGVYSLAGPALRRASLEVNENSLASLEESLELIRESFRDAAVAQVEAKRAGSHHLDPRAASEGRWTPVLRIKR